MAIDTPTLAGEAREDWPSSPPCTQCGSDTDPVVTMRRHTVDADPWFRCVECGYVFTPANDE